MGSKFAIIESSASSYQSKKASLSQECVRRLLNTDDNRAQVERNQMIDEFQKKLQISGYNKIQQKEIIESGLVGYKRRLNRQGGIKHRRSRDTEKERHRKKILGKSTWFKKKRDNKEQVRTDNTGEKDKTNRKRKRKETTDKTEKDNADREPTTVLFVPRTKGGKLAQLLKDKERELNKFSTHKIRIVEKNGDKLEDILVRKDPFGDSKCEKETCLMCRTNDKDTGTCKKPNIVSKIECLACKEKGTSCTYWGETARNGQLRGSEHYKDFMGGRESSHMKDHIEENHPEVGPGDKPENLFRMKIHRRFSSALDRQLGEAVSLASSGGVESPLTMNRKDEYSRCVVPEVRVSEGWRDECKSKRRRDEGEARIITEENEDDKSNPKKRQRKHTEPTSEPTSTTYARGGITATRHPKDTKKPLKRKNPSIEISEKESSTPEPTETPRQAKTTSARGGITATRHPKLTKKPLIEKETSKENLEKESSTQKTPESPVSIQSVNIQIGDTNTVPDPSREKEKVKEKERQVREQGDRQDRKKREQKETETETKTGNTEEKGKKNEEKRSKEDEKKETKGEQRVTHMKENTHTNDKQIKTLKTLRQTTITPVDVRNGNQKLNKLTHKPTLKRKKSNHKLSQTQQTNSIVNYFKITPSGGAKGDQGDLIGGLTLTRQQGPGQDDPQQTQEDPGDSCISITCASNHFTTTDEDNVNHY